MKIISYNVDGLPETLDLKNLPLGLRFISWIYKMIKGTTIIPINDGSDKETAFKNIDKYLTEQDADIIVVQEYFNYPLEFESYNSGTYTGGFDLKKVPGNMTLFPPRFKADGLQIFTKYKILKEDIVSWKKSYGYFSHANDKLTHKGFRYYRLDLGNDECLDLYNVHMDADFFHPENCPDVSKDVKARKSQIDQLIEYVKSHSVGEKVIIIGDTNSYSKYEWDEENIKYLKSNLGCVEIYPNNAEDCDRVFVMNIRNFKNVYLDTKIKYSDHRPLIIDI